MTDAPELTNNEQDLLLKLRGLLPSLRPSEQKVATYVLAHPDEVVHLSITELSQLVEVSDAAIVKFSRRIGYKGYQRSQDQSGQEPTPNASKSTEKLRPTILLA